MSDRSGRSNIKRVGRRTVLYIVVVGVVLVILTPVYFLVSLSFLSTREAYQYPLPLFPDFTTEFKLERGERGYLLSVYDDQSGEYETVLDTEDMEKVSTYMRTFLNTLMTPEEIQQQVDRLESNITVTGMENDAITFTHRRDLFQNYKVFFRITRDAVPALIRSLQIALLTIIISLSIGGMAGYAFARYRFKGREGLKFSVLFVRMFPAVAIAIPMIIILADMGLYDQPLGLSLVYSVGSIGLTVWITASIFMGIPVSLEEAAQVFGASRLRAFLRITLPLAFPGLAAAAMYAFLGAWNETVSAIILTQFRPTFSVVVYQTLLGSTGQVNLAAAAGMTMAVPAVIFTFFIRNYINQMWGGITV
ncbi:MAG: carbohydrate ABC transporter permease [Chloroflexota bacterium]|nr:carbohydrate ABC transporter permease [Chloroflexota bacterium]